MKTLTIFIASAIALCASSPVDNPLSLDFINSINEKQSSWVAGRNFPENTTRAYLKGLNGFKGLHPDPNYKPAVKKHRSSLVDIPTSFDARDKWPNCPSLNRIRNQGSCGSCWAFASTETMSDRLCIQSGGSENFQFSPEDMLSCCTSCGDCTSGYMMAAYDFYINQGIVSGGDVNSNEGCRPYSSEAFNDAQTPACNQRCRDGYSVDYFSDKHYGSKDYIISSSIDLIQDEVMTNGPIIVHFEVFEDFYSYKSGVYHHVSGESDGNHIVKLIGWGTENDTPYWLIANSWGSGWGDLGGYFKIRRGVNEVGIENYPYAVLPRL